jgi:hypothetical protein
VLPMPLCSAVGCTVLPLGCCSAAVAAVLQFPLCCALACDVLQMACCSCVLGTVLLLPLYSVVGCSVIQQHSGSAEVVHAVIHCPQDSSLMVAGCHCQPGQDVEIHWTPGSPAVHSEIYFQLASS